MELYNDDCLNTFQTILPTSVRLVLADLPYAVSQNKWDTIIPLDQLWEGIHRVLLPDGAVVLSATQPFTSQLVNSNLNDFKYEVIWVKTIGSGQLNTKHQPLRLHESLLVFYKKCGVYNPQFSAGTPYTITRKISYNDRGYGKQADHKAINSGLRHPTTVLHISNPRIQGGHPTQKPVALMEYFIKTFSNIGDTILDCCMGSGTTGEAAIKTERQFIGIEKDAYWFDKAKARITAL